MAKSTADKESVSFLEPQPDLTIPEIEDEDYRILVGSRIRKVRRSRGLKIATVAAAVKAEKSVFSRWETGDLMINVVQLRKVAQAIGADVGELLEASNDDE